MVVASPLIYDSANELAQVFRSDYQELYRKDPRWMAAYSYDAVQLILDAVDQQELDISEEKFAKTDV